MKKIVALVLCFLVIAAVLSYVGFFDNPMKTSYSFGSAMGHHSNISYIKGKTSENYDRFLMNTRANKLNEESDSEEEMGDKAPIGGGLSVLVICSMGLAVIKFFDKKRRYI